MIARAAAATSEGAMRIMRATKKAFRNPGISRRDSTQPSSRASMSRRSTMKLLNRVSCTPKNTPTPATAAASRVQSRVQSAKGLRSRGIGHPERGKNSIDNGSGGHTFIQKFGKPNIKPCRQTTVSPGKRW